MIRGTVRGGHNYGVPGASGIVDEVIEDRRYYPLVINKLKNEGFLMQDVTPNKTDTKGEDLAHGVNLANNFQSYFFMSCHLNASNGQGHGCEVVYHSSSAKGKRLAECIVIELAKLGFRNRGAKADTRGLYELKHTSMTAVIIEPFFCDNKEDVAIYRKVGPEGIASAIANGVLNYYGIAKKTSPSSTKLYPVNYCLKWQQFYNTVTQTAKPIEADGVYGKNTQKSLDDLLFYIKQGKKYNYCLEFQKWYNKITQTSKPIVEDGYWGNKTQAAYTIMTKLIRGEY